MADQSLEEFYDSSADPDEWSDETRDELLELKDETKREATVLATDPLLSKGKVYRGDLRVKADFTFNTHILVLGDLVVDGVITASPAHSVLVVAGNITCNGMNMIRSYIFVTGDVTVRDCFYGSVDGMTIIGGTLKTRVYLESHWNNLDYDQELTKRNIRAELKIDLEKHDIRKKLAGVVKASILGAEEFDGYDLLGRIASGVDVFEAAAAKGEKPKARRATKSKRS